jgi:Fe-S-cluster containining protein
MATTTTAVTLIPLLAVAPTKEEVTAQAEKNLALIRQEGAMEKYGQAFMDELRAPIQPRAKMNRLKKLADKISGAVVPHSACRNSCSHCCNISAIITQTEANALATASGRKAKQLSGPPPSSEAIMKYFRVPCPFLKKGRCSVYEDRPLVCRLQFNIADNPHFCDTAIEPKDSHVTMLNVHQLEEGYMMAFLKDTWGDIRDFFPPSA